MTTYQILYWRDIPAQVRVYDGGRARSQKLSERFQEKIDLVAMKEGLRDTDAYLDQWQWGEKLEREGDPAETLEAVVRELEEGFVE